MDKSVHMQIEAQKNAPLINRDQRGVSAHRLVDEQLALDQLAVAVLTNDMLKPMIGYVLVYQFYSIRSKASSMADSSAAGGVGGAGAGGKVASAC